MRVARIEDGHVADLWEVPSLDCYGPEVHLVEVPDDILIGASYSVDAGFVNPPPALESIAPVSPRQIRMALTRAGLRAQVEDTVASGDQDLKDWWEFATTFERTNPQVSELGTALGQSEEQLNALWVLAASL